MAMSDISMAFAAADMPAPCASTAKQGCLVSYIEADRATGNDGATIATHPAAVLHVASSLLMALVAPDTRASGSRMHYGPPPSRLLFCRMLE